MKFIIFDFEVFKYDTLLGCIVGSETGLRLYQTWDLTDMKFFYENNKDCIWIGHNNDAYDNHILKYIVEGGKDVFKKSKSIINQKIRGRADLNIVTYDLMCCRFYSLKMTELLIGKGVHTTDVDFNIDRPLTIAEKQLEEDYNFDDLDQTYMNFLELKDQMLLRLSLISEFKIDKKFLTGTEARLAAMALGAKQIPGIEHQYIAPKMYDTLQVKNQDVINFYLNEGFRKGENIEVVLCGLTHRMGAGGIHAAEKKCHETDFLYLDVSGYYNLVMINYDLLPRTIPQSGKEKYVYMYHQQLELKGKPELATKRWVYKTILLAVFGASINQYTDFYDPQVGTLITIVGQMFLVDLLEKLDGKVKLIQSNTDGIMVKPLPGYTDDDILAIVKEWCNRTGFVIKPKKIREIYQKDVNNYCYINDKGETDTKGDAFIGSWAIDEPVKNEFYTSKEPAIIACMVLNYLTKKIKPEETIQKYKDNLLYFQYLTKKGVFEYCTYDTYDITTKLTTTVSISDLNRAFALKFDGKTTNMIYKHKTRNGKDSATKLSNVPDNIFIYNDEILSKETISKLQQKIDFDWYVDRAYRRIYDFIKLPVFKELNLDE